MRLEKLGVTVFEELDLAQTFLRLFERFIWSAEILSFARQYLVAILQFLDHVGFSPSDVLPLPTIRPQ